MTEARMFKHYSHVPEDAWPCRDFAPWEIASKREGELLVDVGALTRLQALRDAIGAPMVVTSGYRSKAHNSAVGGAKNSMHMQGRAFDIVMANHDPEAFEAAAKAAGFTGFGFYPSSGFMHIDTGPPREWGKRWPRTATRTPAEPERGPSSPVTDKKALATIAAGFSAVGPSLLPGGIGALHPAAQIAFIGIAAGAVVYMLARPWLPRWAR